MIDETRPLTASDIEVPAYLDKSEMQDDFNAPEAGSYAPRLFPGVYPARFELVPMKDRDTGEMLPGGLGTILVDDKQFPKIQYNVHVPVADIPAESFVTGEKPSDDRDITIRFNEATAFKTKLGISALGEVCRTFGWGKTHGDDIPKNHGEAIRWLKSVSGDATGDVEIGWVTFDRDAKREISTHPYLGKKTKGVPTPDIPWTMEENGNGRKRPVLQVKFASGGAGYGREKVVRLLKPRPAVAVG